MCRFVFEDLFVRSLSFLLCASISLSLFSFDGFFLSFPSLFSRKFKTKFIQISKKPVLFHPGLFFTSEFCSFQRSVFEDFSSKTLRMSHITPPSLPLSSPHQDILRSNFKSKKDSLTLFFFHFFSFLSFIIFCHSPARLATPHVFGACCAHGVCAGKLHTLHSTPNRVKENISVQEYRSVRE